MDGLFDGVSMVLVWGLIFSWVFILRKSFFGVFSAVKKMFRGGSRPGFNRGARSRGISGNFV